MKKHYYLLVFLSLLLLCVIPSIVFELNLSTILMLKNLEALGIKQFIFFSCGSISLFLFLLSVIHLSYRLYQHCTFYYFSNLKYLILDIIIALALFLVTFMFLPGLITINGSYLFLDICANYFELVDSSELEQAVIYLMNGNIDETVPKVPSLNDHTIVYGETADKRKYLCANLSKIVNQALDPGIAKTGTQATMKFFKVPEVVCIGLTPLETPTSNNFLCASIFLIFSIFFLMYQLIKKLLKKILVTDKYFLGLLLYITFAYLISGFLFVEVFSQNFALRDPTTCKLLMYISNIFSKICLFICIYCLILPFVLELSFFSFQKKGLSYISLSLGWFGLSCFGEFLSGYYNFMFNFFSGEILKDYYDHMKKKFTFLAL
jgi:hypothetical protein